MASIHPVALHQLIHSEEARLQHEQLVFQVANALATSFNLRGTGHTLQHWLNEEPTRTDAEILIQLVTETLLAWEQEQVGQIVDRLITVLEQAMMAEEVISCQK